MPEVAPHNLGQFYFLIDPQSVSGDAFWERQRVNLQYLGYRRFLMLLKFRRMKNSQVLIDN